MKLPLLLAPCLLAFLTGCSSDEALTNNVPAVDPGTGAVTASYNGRAIYRTTRGPVVDITVQVAGAEDDGTPTDDVFGTTHTDTRGHFTVTSTAPRDRKVVLVAAAVEEMAESGGDRRGVGYEIKKHETVLGTLPNPSSAQPNTLLVNPKQPRPPGE